MFQDIKSKRILIYGTGKVAERCVADISSESQVIGIIDKVKFCGEKCGFPILMWDDIQPGDAEAIVIAAPQKYYYDIYQRIVNKCISFGMKIYGYNGKDLIRYFGLGMNSYQNFGYYEKNADDLRRTLEKYDIVSFDIFDTLIMRKTLEPTDIFDMVEYRLKLIGMDIKGFKAIRRQAELQSQGQNLYKIYDILQEMTGMSENWKNRILQEELECEKEFIVGRHMMVELFNSVIANGKKVYLVSDMYLTSEMLESILEGVGICGYEKIFVSCEYGVGKGNGLFKELCKAIGQNTCIHIGDNEESDVKAAMREGIDAYGVQSAYSMLRNSNLNYALGLAHNMNDKNLLGLVLSQIFNDPFSLYHTSGAVRLSSLKIAGMIMLAPLIIGYMDLLLEKIEEGKYDGIIFVSRDGYFFKNLYDKLNGNILDKISSFYVYSSRRLAIRLGMDTHREIDIAEMNVSAQRINKIFFGAEESCQYDCEREMIEQSQKNKKNYIKYLKDIGIDLDKKYLYCELDGKGTELYYLNRLFNQGLDSLYVIREHIMDDVYKLDTEAMYDIWPGDDNSINRHKAFVESIFSAPHPSVENMDDKGKPIFSKEVRHEKQIVMMTKLQDAMMEFCEEFFRTMYVKEKPLNRELPQYFLELFPYMIYEGECEELYYGKLADDLMMDFTTEQYDIITRERHG